MSGREESFISNMAAYAVTKSLFKHIVESDDDISPDDFKIVYRMFVTIGGSWQRVINGSSDDIELLKKTLFTFEQLRAERKSDDDESDPLF